MKASLKLDVKYMQQKVEHIIKYNQSRLLFRFQLYLQKRLESPCDFHKKTFFLNEQIKYVINICFLTKTNSKHGLMSYYSKYLKKKTSVIGFLRRCKVNLGCNLDTSY